MDFGQVTPLGFKWVGITEKHNVLVSRKGWSREPCNPMLECLQQRPSYALSLRIQEQFRDTE